MVGVIASGAIANPQSRELVGRGAVDLSQDKLQPALTSFEAAAKADATDSEAVYFQAVALNRLGRHADALTALDRASTLGYRHRDVALERGWALVGVRRWDEAIVSLNTFESTDPGRGQTSLLLGQAYRGKNQGEQARASFQVAARRDPTLAPQTAALLADVAAGAPMGTQGQTAASAAQSPRAGSLRNQGAGGDTILSASTNGATTWNRRTRGAVGMSAGNNSNVISLGDSVLAGEISSVSDTFVQMWADFSADWQFNASDGLTLGYYGTVTNYDDLGAFDLTDHIGYITYRHLFQQNLLGTISVADDYTSLGGLAFRNSFSVRPALNYLLEDGDSIELAYYYSRNNFFFDTLPAFDRDGDTSSLSLTHYFHLKDTKFTGRVGYYKLWNSTRGSDFDFDSDGLIFGLAHPIGTKGASVFGFYSHTWDDYDNLNSLTGFTFARSDQTDRLSLQVSVPVRRQLTAFGRYEHTNVNSNVSLFAFDQDIYSGGVAAGF